MNGPALNIDNLYVVDVEAPFGFGAPSVTQMTEFAAVHVATGESFHGRMDKTCLTGSSVQDTYSQGEEEYVMRAFNQWLLRREGVPRGRPIFVSDNPAYDWQWINCAFWKYLFTNPFGHSARRIGDFYAGLVGDWTNQSRWKELRVTKHDHNPVNDARGNAEALVRMFNGER